MNSITDDEFTTQTQRDECKLTIIFISFLKLNYYAGQTIIGGAHRQI